MNTAPITPRVIRCPGCGGPSVYSSANAHRPFCSPRCKNQDFGAWASERYGVPADEPDILPDDANPEPPPAR
ncbi:MAG: DNA gyrase inhibitor YacG [Burkholderiaceae bacterium]